MLNLATLNVCAWPTLGANKATAMRKAAAGSECLVIRSSVMDADRLRHAAAECGMYSSWNPRAASQIGSTRLRPKPSRHGVEIAGYEPRQPGILVTGSGPGLEKQMIGLGQNNLGDVAIPGLAQRALDRRPGLPRRDIGVQLPEEQQHRAGDSPPAHRRIEVHEHAIVGAEPIVGRAWRPQPGRCGAVGLVIAVQLLPARPGSRDGVVEHLVARPDRHR